MGHVMPTTMFPSTSARYSLAVKICAKSSTNSAFQWDLHTLRKLRRDIFCTDSEAQARPRFALNLPKTIEMSMNCHFARLFIEFYPCSARQSYWLTACAAQKWVRCAFISPRVGGDGKHPTVTRLRCLVNVDWHTPYEGL